MKTEKLVYQAPETELLMTQNGLPLCSSANQVDPFTGEPLGDEF